MRASRFAIVYTYSSKSEVHWFETEDAARKAGEKIVRDLASAVVLVKEIATGTPTTKWSP